MVYIQWSGKLTQWKISILQEKMLTSIEYCYMLTFDMFAW